MEDVCVVGGLVSIFGEAGTYLRCWVRGVVMSAL